MEVNSTTPKTKPQPVVIYGAIVAGATTTLGTLTVLFKDNPQAVLWIGIASAVLGGAAVVKDQIVKGMTVPAADTVAYVNEERKVVTGPASVGPDGVEVQSMVTENVQEAASQPYEDPADYGRGVAGF